VVFKTAGFVGFQAIVNIPVAGSSHKHDAFASQPACKVRVTPLYASLRIDLEIWLIQIPILVACRFSSLEPYSDAILSLFMFLGVNPNAALVYPGQRKKFSIPPTAFWEHMLPTENNELSTS